VPGFFKIIEAFPFAILPPWWLIPEAPLPPSNMLEFLVECAVPCLEEVRFYFNEGWEMKLLLPIKL
jgi:hypothetical protein